jgi:hypothetical protein
MMPVSKRTVSSNVASVIDLGTFTQPVAVTLPQDARGARGSVPLVCAAWSDATQQWDSSACRAQQSGVLTATHAYVCLCDTAAGPFATLLGAPVDLPPGSPVW